MIAPARQVSYELLCSIEQRSVFSDFALNSPKMAELEARDRNLATEIVYGTLRWQELLDYILSKATKRPWEKIDLKVKVLLRMSLYQILFTRRIPSHALVDDAVELSKRDFHEGIAGFVNGILRSLIRGPAWTEDRLDRECPPWIRVSLPRWLWERWETRFGAVIAKEYALSLNQPPRNAFRLYERELPEWAEASDLVPGAVFAKEGQDAPRSGDAALPIQDEASQLIPHLFGLVTSARIWDVCAAPGGKSAILASLSGNRGHVVSSDLHFHRAKRLQEALGERHDCLVLDGACPPPFLKPFDAVLVDAPCSGLGTLRRNPEIKWKLRSEDLSRLAALQGNLLKATATAVRRRGGCLLYSTCSTEPEENENVVGTFLREHPDFQLKRPDTPRGIEAWLGPDGMVRTFPSTRPWDGFFAALMVAH